MNLPNALTVLRFLMIPYFIHFYLSPLSNGVQIAVLIFVTAGLTDVLDGYIARKYHLVTKFGVIMDPLADKLMLITALVCITMKNHLPIWIVAIVVIKESFMILGASMLYKHHDIAIPSNKFGKASTVLCYAAVLSFIFHLKFYMFLFILFLVVTIVALYTYFGNFIDIKRKIKEQAKELAVDKER